MADKEPAMMEIRQLERAELPLLKDFAPPEWNTDLSVTFGLHFNQPYFHPIVATMAGRIVGCANALVQGSAGWLGNIIVLPELRGQGIGRALTQHLVEFLRRRGVPHQLLIATRMGEPVYRKLGFECASYYLFFARQGASIDAVTDECIRPLRRGDEPSVFLLDARVTGEMRPRFLERYLDGALVHASSSGEIDGYYLPPLGAGLVVASNDEAGLALLASKVSTGGDTCVVPEQNELAADWLRARGFVETSRAPRMALGPEIGWQPRRVYSRGSGFSG